MACRVARDMTVEEFDAWSAARKRTAAVAESAEEDGGPRLSLVPVPDQQDAWPTDLLAPAPLPEGAAAPPDESALGQPPVPAMPFDGVPLDDSRNRLAGWSADRQRLFLTHLAETGSVHLACGSARLSARGAYRLRARSPAFARGWDMAQRLSVGRLSAIAFDRALNGRLEQVYRDGELVAERRVPNDKMLMWLLARLDPKRFAMPWEQRGDADPQAEAVAAFPALLDAITDTPA
ncbi:hypothetical protein [Sphingomonas sp.]|uniref:hypothetical protein n=1 Tax=Sphingomonas sp. TaxID=28214 RepID=UPI00286AD3A6|nr:hypothetical protein [Sphingomonas sp.]